MADLETKKKDLVKSALSKVVMHDAGIEEGKGLESCAVSPSKPKSKYYPTIYLEGKQAPALKGANVGDECTLVIKAKVVGVSLDEREDSKREEYRLEIHEIGKVDKGSGKDY
jgi:hypothetical protein